MVDASTGGKTGINTPQGKNLVGSFYTPAGVLADLKTLVSLPNDIFIEGLGEVAKSGFIKDPEILHILEEHAAELRAFDGATFLGSGLENVVAELIERTVRVKAYHVSADLKEAGLREFLNYGHTLAHAIEKLGSISAGATATRSRSDACMRRNWVRSRWAISTRISSIITALCSGSLGLPTSWNGGTFDEVLALMHRDRTARLVATSCGSSCSIRSAIRCIWTIRRRTRSRRRSDVSRRDDAWVSVST